jgi:hypothetical protein
MLLLMDVLPLFILLTIFLAANAKNVDSLYLSLNYNSIPINNDEATSVTHCYLTTYPPPPQQ